MALNLHAVKLASGSWQFTWDDIFDEYDIWLDGYKIESEIEEPEYEFTNDGYVSTPPAIEIFEAGETPLNDIYSPYLFLQWRGIVAAKFYNIKQFVGASWRIRGHLKESGAGYYQFHTPALADNSYAKWRVYAVDINGNEGDPIEFDVYIVRNPAPPAVSITYTKPNLVIGSA